MYVDVISAFEELPAHRQDNDMKLAIVGGAPCSPALIKEFKATFPAVKLGVSTNSNVSGDLKSESHPNYSTTQLLIPTTQGVALE